MRPNMVRFSNGSGRVDIAWNVSSSGVAEPLLTMSWVEAGWPPRGEAAAARLRLHGDFQDG